MQRKKGGAFKAACEPALVCRGQNKLNGTRLVTVKVESGARWRPGRVE